MNKLGSFFRSPAAILLLVGTGGCATGASANGFVNPGDDGSTAPAPQEGAGAQPSADGSSRGESVDFDAARDLASDAGRSLDAFAEPDATDAWSKSAAQPSVATNGEVNPDSGTGSPDVGDATDDGTFDGGDGGGDSNAPTPVTPSAGDLLITEVMFYPSGPEPQSEWFEVYNPTGMPLLLSGLTIQDGYPRAHVIASNPPVVAPPLAYVLLVRNGLAATDNLLPPAAVVYEYGAGLPADQGIQLQNGLAGDVSLWSGTTLLVDVPYGPWGMASVGQSIELASLQFTSNTTQAAWCLGQYSWAAGADYGTPGRASDCP
jgi:hypothetical protein